METRAYIQVISCPPGACGKANQDTVRKDSSVQEIVVSRIGIKVTVLDQKFTVLDQKFTVLDQKFTVLDEKVTGLELVIENETNVNIRRIAEGHCDLVRNLREARKVDDEKELLAIRVTVLESDMSKVKHQLAIT